MGRLSVFNFITLDGYFKGLDEDTSWHQDGNEEEGEFAEEGAQSESTLIFGRKTYEMMAGFWPMPMATESMPKIAEGMNQSEKIVFSKTLRSADWNNTRIVEDEIINEVKRLKEIPGKRMTILGSGSIVSQLADAGLIDDFQIMIDLIAIGNGTSIFSGISKPLNLKLVSTRTFKTGVVLLNYKYEGA